MRFLSRLARSCLAGTLAFVRLACLCVAAFLAAAADGQLAVAGEPPADLVQPLATLRRVGPEGQGHAEATRAWSQLAHRPAADLPALLAAMDGANPLVRNWLRAAVDAVADRTLASGESLPLAALEAFLRDTHHDPHARWLAYDWIARVDPDRARSLVPGLLEDPSNALRRLAIEQRQTEAQMLRTNGQLDQARTVYQTALRAARDVDQIEALATALRELDVPVDLRDVFGWITRWQVIGPFDNTGLAGFDRPFPPESEQRLDAEYDGKAGKVRWREWIVADPYGRLDFNRALGAAKEVTAYALTEFVTDQPQPAEIRLGCKNAWKVWFNGQFLFGRDEYHRGAEIDQYRLPVTLQAGTNSLLVKVCQNEEVEDWTVEWEFQLRLTDPLGTPLRSPTSHTAAPKPPPFPNPQSEPSP